ncbi:SGNH/GDSL hydrolase family protein [Pseudomonas sp. OVF7]|uniref:SGNH/GDSL hydrolase family protein n=1 Tax=unclassified Pseudomonas TaxID=196821 RepID=UPI00272BA38D|nr:hypothetical protein [Pseudomonas sp. OVF7]WLD64691.1 hypothetical protein QU606_20285 [Pseudomonas sp. OVF7]
MKIFTHGLISVIKYSGALFKAVFSLSFVAAIFCASGCAPKKEFKAVPPPSEPANPEMVFIGNSLTFHPASAELGWYGAHGMAAKYESTDYVHVTLRELGISADGAYARNFYPFESDDGVTKSHIDSLASILSKSPKIVVLQLGDNVELNKKQKIQSVINLYNFWSAYGDLLDAVKKTPAQIYCVSTWWQSDWKDRAIKQRCEAAGGTYVYIGDIYTDPGNTDRAMVDYPSAGVDSHPKDYGMKAISDRLVAAIKAK